MGTGSFLLALILIVGVIDEEFEPGFAAKPRIVHTVWSHIHPLCSNLSLYECKGGSRKKLISVGAKTETTNGLELNILIIGTQKKVFFYQKTQIMSYKLLIKIQPTHPKIPWQQQASSSKILHLPDLNGY